MTAIRALLTQARHELGLLRVLQECTVVPAGLLAVVAILGTAAEMAHG